MEFLILQSQKDPDFYIITDERNIHRAVQEYRENQPGDELTPIVEGQGGSVLAENRPLHRGYERRPATKSTGATS